VSYSLNDESSAIDLLMSRSILGVGEALRDVDFLELKSRVSRPLKGLNNRETSVIVDDDAILPELF
jgi:hypothetical protein